MKLNQENYKDLDKTIFKILIIFSSILIVVYLSIDTYFFSNQFKKLALNNAVIKIEERESYLQKFLEKSKVELHSINNSKIFMDFKYNQKNLELTEDLFLYTTKNNTNIMQLRYIDKDGNEKIRINRKTQNEKPSIIQNDMLQDKSKRDYFFKSKDKAFQKVWFSELDLNMDYDVIERPFKATLRGVLPLKKNGSFDGIIIINYFMNDFLASFVQDNLYNSILIDDEGYTLIHYEYKNSWGRYKSPQIKLSNISPIFKERTYSKELIKDVDFVSKGLNTEIANKLILILKLNKKYLEEEKINELNSKILISLLIFILSIILITIISRVIKDLILELSDYNEYITLIDENIISSTTDLDGRITYASKAFCNISGYEEEELVGKKHSIVKHPTEDKRKYKNLWNKLLNDDIWEGELKNKTKDGNVYWVQAKIYPIYDSKSKKIGYTGIRQDITDKKRVEEISIHDGLTNLYNRKYFDEVMPKILNEAKRRNELLSFIMLDVDFFKSYNDTYGHQSGDETLKAIASMLKESLKRSSDNCFRIGGEEFVVVFKSNTIVDANKFAERVRVNIENLKIKHSKSKINKYVTVSMGLYSQNAKAITSYEDIYKLSDDLLYKAKESGRNRIKSN